MGQDVSIPLGDWLKGTGLEADMETLENPKNSATFVMDLLGRIGTDLPEQKVTDLPPAFLKRGLSYVAGRASELRPSIPLVSACTVYINRWIQADVKSKVGKFVESGDTAYADLVTSYIQFLALRAEGHFAQKPPLPLWALWHSHMLRPLSFREMSARITFKRVDHSVVDDMPDALESSPEGIARASAALKEAVARHKVNVAAPTMGRIRRELMSLISLVAFLKDLTFFEDLTRVLLNYTLGNFDISAQAQCAQTEEWMVRAEQDVKEATKKPSSDTTQGKETETGNGKEKKRKEPELSPLLWVLPVAERVYFHFLVMAGEFGEPLVHVPFSPSTRRGAEGAAEKKARAATVRRSELAWSLLVGWKAEALISESWKEEKKRLEAEWEKRKAEGNFHTRSLPDPISMAAWVEAVSDPSVEIMVALAEGGMMKVEDLSPGVLVLTGQQPGGRKIEGSFGNQQAVRAVARVWKCPVEGGQTRVILLRGGCELTEGHPVWEEGEMGGKERWVKVEE
eukprot:Cvel_15138.t1-p1 / transcript=Cvel_15138.t1 / gene=Cvel_15138 / organism=Chromera_velia_CCMP2878 / gene_product=hypothetical protein / transcript_product=hypothetical protein / location=Cvel_scaffold1104:49907-55584(+) / protein_length=511 / sequence_SO=supercontig / SO=protein_coding / is_pseudo=false